MAQLRRTGDPSPVNWHSAFFEAIQLELAPFSSLLDFQAEVPLNTAPLRIDVLIIKKHKATPISKNIAAIFRSVNIVEYKSPGDYLSIEDFYKVYGYACLYAALEHVPITGCTLSFVERRRPREVLAHLREVRGYRVEEKSPGIYSISGDILPIQIIESKRLSAGENLWLRDLDNRLGAAELWEVVTAAEGLGKGKKVEAYLEVIMRANKEKVKEALEMDKDGSGSSPAKKMMEMVRRWKDKERQEGRLEGRKEGKCEVAKKLIAKGWPPEEVAETTGLGVRTVRSLYREGAGS
jgi:hypothetical protein